jgi:hypothetical protein
MRAVGNLERFLGSPGAAMHGRRSIFAQRAADQID